MNRLFVNFASQMYRNYQKGITTIPQEVKKHTPASLFEAIFNQTAKNNSEIKWSSHWKHAVFVISHNSSVLKGQWKLANEACKAHWYTADNRCHSTKRKGTVQSLCPATKHSPPSRVCICVCVSSDQSGRSSGGRGSVRDSDRDEG